MATLTTTNGTFDADTIEECVKLEKKAARAAAKVEKGRSALREVARLRAQAAAWRIAHWNLTGTGYPRGWMRHEPDSQFSPTKILAGDADSYRELNLRVETEHGTADIKLYAQQLAGTVENGAGFTLAVILRDMDDMSRATTVHAVGVHEGQVCFEMVPTFTGDEFRRHGATEAA